MADILIHGISMPRERDHLTITINADGTVQPLVDMYCPIIAHAVELPEHGDLIDRVAFRAEMDKHYPFDHGTQRRHGEADKAKSTVINMLANAPVIVPSNKEETE